MKVSINKINPMKRKQEAKRQPAELKNPISRAIREWKIKRYLKVFFKNVHNANCSETGKDIIFKCSEINLDFDNPHVGNMFHFKTERDAVYAICQCVYVYFFRKYGITVQNTNEEHGIFLFCVYNAYLKRGKH